ncbi:hypothetical protein E3U43_016640 [Larimichthys crocea]|uniref:Uncharacterized protein n=1 Tax=Larimichthys crocea TaxID=215358 RepID=A0ACD3QI36_LARCR|nr:hypothetical protein E3U43_016640 [Larimichthys crocea]
MKLAAQSPSTRMSLRSFRSSPLVPMETSSSSSSDDSCDSFGSDWRLCKYGNDKSLTVFLTIVVVVVSVQHHLQLKIASVFLEEQPETDEEDGTETKGV